MEFKNLTQDEMNLLFNGYLDSKNAKSKRVFDIVLYTIYTLVSILVVIGVFNCYNPLLLDYGHTEFYLIAFSLFLMLISSCYVIVTSIIRIIRAINRRVGLKEFKEALVYKIYDGRHGRSIKVKYSDDSFDIIKDYAYKVKDYNVGDLVIVARYKKLHFIFK